MEFTQKSYFIFNIVFPDYGLMIKKNCSDLILELVKNFDEMLKQNIKPDTFFIQGPNFFLNTFQNSKIIRKISVIWLCQGLAKSGSIIGAVPALSLYFQVMSYLFDTIPGNTMNTKYLYGAYQLQCNDVHW